MLWVRAISERRLKRHSFIDQNENVISLGLVMSGVYSILDDDDILEDVLQNGDILMCALCSSSDDAVITGTTVLHTPNSTISNIKIFIQLTEISSSTNLEYIQNIHGYLRLLIT